MEDNGPLRIQSFEAQPHGFAEPASDAIAVHGAPKRARYREADPRAFRLSQPETEGGKQRT